MDLYRYKQYKSQIIILIVLCLMLGLFFLFDLHQYVDLNFFQTNIGLFRDHYERYPIQSRLIFFFSYMLITGISLPGAGVMSLLAGALFGLVWGVILVSFGSVLGAACAFLCARYLFYDQVQQRFMPQLKKINYHIEADGHSYLFAIRLMPVFPFFLVNILAAMTHIKLYSFMWVSQLGMLLPTIILVNAGKQLAQIEQLNDIFSWQILLSFSLIGILPLLVKHCLQYLKRHSFS